MPQISVIVPVYKVEPYLHRCVDSILAQTFTDFELILVDDGSPDRCPAICEEYAEKDCRIHVIHQKNSGLSAARNAGIRQSNGTYICFIDSDDFVSPDYCQILYHAAMSSNCRISACKVTRFSEDAPLPEEVAASQDDSRHVSTMPFSEFLMLQMTQEIEMGVCNRLYHRSVFQEIRFMPGKLHEDIIFAGDLLTEINCDVAYIDVPLYYYRQRANSIVNQQANSTKCSPDRVFAGNYLLECSKVTGFAHMDKCLKYVIQYPWSFVDPIYVHVRFKQNREFMNAIQKMIRHNRDLYRNMPLFSEIQRKRMLLFARSKILYGFNAYARLLRVYLYHLLKRDAYADGHGI